MNSVLGVGRISTAFPTSYVYQKPFRKTPGGSLTRLMRFLSPSMSSRFVLSTTGAPAVPPPAVPAPDPPLPPVVPPVGAPPTSPPPSPAPPSERPPVDPPVE